MRNATESIGANVEASVAYQADGNDRDRADETSDAAPIDASSELLLLREPRDLFAYWILLKARWRIIAVLSASAAVLTLVVGAFLVTPFYRAEAVIRPVAQPGAQLSAFGQSLPGQIQSGAMAVLSEGLGGGGNRAQEYMSILRSYDFNVALIERYHLTIGDDARRGGWFGLGSQSAISKWRLYQIMRKRFDCQYDYVTGDVTLHFLDRDAVRATRILGLYLESLREKLRHEQVSSADAAATALRAEALGTSDTLLQTQLYELISRQLQREKLAQVEADFAFKVIDGPVAPDRPYSPRPLMDAILAGVITLFLISLWIILRDYLERSHAAYRSALEDARRAGSGRSAERRRAGEL